MRQNNFGFVVVLAVSWVLAGAIVDGQQTASSDDDAFAKALKQEAAGISQTSIDEIIEIRKRLGGGIGLGGSNPLFDSAQNQKVKRPAQTKSSLDHQIPNPDDACTDSERLFFELLGKGNPIHVGRQLIESDENDRAANLRSTARRVDQLAADLEELELFADADELRSFATKMRKKARENRRTANSRRELR